MHVTDINLIGVNAAHVTVQDMVVMTVISSGVDGIQLFCSSMELLRNQGGAISGGVDSSIFGPILTASEYTEQATITGINNIWFHVRCAVSYDDRKMYSLIRSDTNENYNERNINPEILYTHAGNTYYNNTFWRRIYKANEKTSVDFTNFNSFPTKTHLRNFYLFREVIPFDMKLKY